MNKVNERFSTYTSDYINIYIVIGLFCAVLIGTMLIHRRRQITEILDGMLHRIALWLTMGFVVSDVLWFIMDQEYIPQAYWSLMFLKSLYFFFTTAMCFAWFLYFENAQKSALSTDVKRLHIAMLPMILHGVLLLVNPWTGWLFQTDAQMNYYRGPIYPIQYILAYMYVFSTCGGALYRAFMEHNYAEREKYITIALFPVAPLICGLIQFFEWRLPCAAPGVTIAEVILYLNILEQAVSRDTMTGLNNRRQFLRDADKALKEHGTDGKVRILMVDLDHFKQINDQFGHLEGDNALMRAASIMKRSVNLPGQRNILARYGGDEFVILMSNATHQDERTLRHQIQDALDKENANEAKGYKIKLSIGSADNSETNALRLMMNKADENMYQEKQMHHNL